MLIEVKSWNWKYERGGSNGAQREKGHVTVRGVALRKKKKKKERQTTGVWSAKPR